MENYAVVHQLERGEGRGERGEECRTCCFPYKRTALPALPS